MGALADEDPQWFMCSKKCHVLRLCRLFAIKEAKTSALSLIMFGIQSYKVHGFAVRELHHLIFFLVMFPAAVHFLRSVPGSWRKDPNYTPKLLPMLIYLCCLPISILDLIVGIVLNSVQLVQNEAPNTVFTGIAIGGACMACIITVFSLYVTVRAYQYAKLRVQSKSRTGIALPAKA